jgi:ParB-like chromosome segregation protein Spo0J
MRTRTVKGIEYAVSEAHPAAEVLPWMTDDELQRLADDIAAKGQLHPIDRLPDGRIIDGRNRELACRMAGIEPEYQRCDYTGAQIVGHVVSLNVPRRHLSPSQLAMVAAELANGARTDLQPCAPVHKVEGEEAVGISQTEAADMVGVSRRSVASAVKVKNEAPELVEAVKDGTLDVKTAEKVAKLPADKRKKVAGAKNPKKAAKESLAEEAVAAAHEEQTGEKEADPAAEFVASVESLCRDMDQIAARLKALKESLFSYCMHVDSAVSASPRRSHAARRRRCRYCRS